MLLAILAFSSVACVTDGILQTVAALFISVIIVQLQALWIHRPVQFL